jgi:N-methylhydantoinase B
VAIITRANGGQTSIRKETEIVLEPGDRVSFLTAGGGGYGEPRLRSEDAIRRDLAEGFLTKQGVEEYGAAAGARA